MGDWQAVLVCQQTGNSGEIPGRPRRCVRATTSFQITFRPLPATVGEKAGSSELESQKTYPLLMAADSARDESTTKFPASVLLPTGDSGKVDCSLVNASVSAS